MFWSLVSNSVGSSPLTRGKRSSACWGGVAAGLIPAHAGKTPGPGPHGRRGRAHPRSRGENGWSCPRSPTTGGSSPLTRGKLRAGRGKTKAVGLIPAHAGKTRASMRRGSTGRAHPRSRGENGLPVAALIGEQGSSPLTRGKRTRTSVWKRPSGLIPAHAGKTYTGAVPALRAGAHPRSRGENLRLYGLGALREGSSPLTRGKRGAFAVATEEHGLIPAHAGKTRRTQARRL